MESYPTVHSFSSSFEEKISIPLVAQTTVTMYVRRTVISCTFECSYSSVLRPILMKLHISTRLIDSFPLPCCPKTCDKEKMSITLEAHHKAQSSEIFLSFPPKIRKSCNFLSFGQSC